MSVLSAVAEESKKITDDVDSEQGVFGKFFDTLISAISNGIFKSPPFSLENFFPQIALFKNKYFKTAAIFVIYLGLIGSILTAFKPTNTRDMFLTYSVCFWIAAVAISLLIINPYDENSVEYMLRDKVIQSIVPSEVPVEVPSDVPVEVPSEVPVEVPVEVPSDVPSEVPSDVKTNVPAKSIDEEQKSLTDTIKSFF